MINQPEQKIGQLRQGSALAIELDSIESLITSAKEQLWGILKALGRLPGDSNDSNQIAKSPTQAKAYLDRLLEIERGLQEINGLLNHLATLVG